MNEIHWLSHGYSLLYLLILPWSQLVAPKYLNTSSGVPEDLGSGKARRG